MARDEWPLLGQSMAHALTNIVDELVVINHCSSDGTEAGLRKIQGMFPGRVRVFALEDPRFLQEEATALFAALTSAQDFDWFYVFDADEFLLTSTEASLKQILLSIDSNVDALRYEVTQFMVESSGYRGPGANLNLRPIFPSSFAPMSNALIAEEIENDVLNYFDISFPSKLIVRGSLAHRLTAGAHNLRDSGKVLEKSLDRTVVQAGHMPLRSRDYLEQKARTGKALVELGFPPSHGWQNQMLARIADAGDLDKYWEAHSYDPITTKVDGHHFPPLGAQDEKLVQAMHLALSAFELAQDDPTPLEDRAFRLEPTGARDLTWAGVMDAVRLQTEAHLEAIASRDEAIASRDEAVEATRSIQQSKSWRATYPMRFLLGAIIRRHSGD
tara:strand:- start:932 stop:2089 length:1158 start_codon:yes stop_codon:yes gene_type:complete